MDPLSDVERKERERAFHDERFATDQRAALDRVYEGNVAVAWYREAVLAAAPGRRVLEYGCGTGGIAFAAAEVAAHVQAIDISPVAVEAVRDEAARRGVAVTADVMDAEALDLPDASFDLVCGTGILHHLDLAASMREIRRVLTPTGRAIFLEPLGHNPVINLFRAATPRARTRDEHPLRVADLDAMGALFGRVDVRHFGLLGLAGLAPGVPRRVGAALDRADDRLFRRWPRTGRYAWMAAILLAGPR